MKLARFGESWCEWRIPATNGSENGGDTVCPPTTRPTATGVAGAVILWMDARDGAGSDAAADKMCPMRRVSTTRNSH